MSDSFVTPMDCNVQWFPKSNERRQAPIRVLQTPKPDEYKGTRLKYIQVELLTKNKTKQKVFKNGQTYNNSKILSTS